MVFSGCSKDDTPPPGQKSFSDFSERVVNSSQNFETKSPEKKQEQAVVEEEERPLKIGVIAPQSGEEAYIGRMTLGGVKMAAELFNSGGGVGGRPVEYIDIDNKGESGSTQSALKQLISENVVAIIGSPTGWSTFTPVFAANDSKTIFISAGTRRHIGSSGSYVFRMSLPVEQAADELMEHCIGEEGMKEFFIVTVMEDEALNVAGAFRRSVYNRGGVIKGEASIFSSDDLEESLKTLKEKMPVDAVIFAGGPDTALAFAKKASASGLKLPLIGGEELYDERFLAGGRAVEGSYVYAGFVPDDTEPVTRRFIDSYKVKYGKAPDSFAAEAYDSFMLLALTIKDVGAAKPDTVRRTMLEVKDFPGVTGTISVGPDGEVVRSPYLLKAVRQGKKYGFSILKTAHKPCEQC